MLPSSTWVPTSAITTSTIAAALSPVTPNFTSDLFVAPRNIRQGEISRLFLQADGDARSSFMAVGLRRN